MLTAPATVTLALGTIESKKIGTRFPVACGMRTDVDMRVLLCSTGSAVGSAMLLVNANVTVPLAELTSGMVTCVV